MGRSLRGRGTSGQPLALRRILIAAGPSGAAPVRRSPTGSAVASPAPTSPRRPLDHLQHRLKTRCDTSEPWPSCARGSCFQGRLRCSRLPCTRQPPLNGGAGRRPLSGGQRNRHHGGRKTLYGRKEQVHHSGTKVPQRGIYECDSGCGHSTDVKGYVFPPLPQGCEGEGWVLRMPVADRCCLLRANCWLRRSERGSSVSG